MIADIARRVADRQHDAQWRFTLTDPDTGQPLHTGITRKRPTTQQRRDVTARHRTCVLPGCRMPAVDCDLDHRARHTDGGPTVRTWSSRSELPSAGRRPTHHHTIRHRAGWTYQRLPNGDHLFTTLLRCRYTTSGRPP